MRRSISAKAFVDGRPISFENCDRECFLRFEVIVKGAFWDSGCGSDLLNATTIEAILVDELFAGSQ